ncbi:hypothetical protein P1P91_13580 [Halomonas piscis]|uniref:YtxH domain-containing protein n=1 Tax=Halomonas piscis TaxID=3031727 RepID=A0ABY9YYA6_9GAMM|nr:hypothetical protein [Halomonas piscis]WNK19845.1 hypothetical protein P1P91_13580 [Halomonas piscis]
MKATMRQLAVVLGILMMAGGLAACEEQGPAEEAGESIDESMESAGESLEEAGDEIQSSAEDAAE